ncbi:hypothetical protein F9278_36275 [Streptomyces phaeolivaceus]|uniref:Uncharacterized protein n=1 Tax=Streptomyces phaeolivaceus TaxID=2653200 RepID=A0A5P8KBM7_9ACTN|nr:hypothetical protein [Streptomyces phaeolivaceus]QFR00734.1 hypothetical protein F9278_36275 [Streptomyces phaeolivaceus]
MKTVPPNPYSPYATASPAERHLFLTIVGPPAPGALVHTACDRLAVVPDDVIGVDPAAEELPAGLCATCAAVFRGLIPPITKIETACVECGGATIQNHLCAVCRTQAHLLWTRVRTTTVPPPPDAPFLAQGGPIHVTPSAWCEHGDLVIGARFHGYYLNGEPHETHIDVLLPRCYLATVIGAVLALVDLDPSPAAQDRFTDAVNETQNTVRAAYRQRLDDGEAGRG